MTLVAGGPSSLYSTLGLPTPSQGSQWGECGHTRASSTWRGQGSTGSHCTILHGPGTGPTYDVAPPYSQRLHRRMGRQGMSVHWVWGYCSPWQRSCRRHHGWLTMYCWCCSMGASTTPDYPPGYRHTGVALCSQRCWMAGSYRVGQRICPGQHHHTVCTRGDHPRCTEP